MNTYETFECGKCGNIFDISIENSDEDIGCPMCGEVICKFIYLESYEI